MAQMGYGQLGGGQQQPRFNGGWGMGGGGMPQMSPGLNSFYDPRISGPIGNMPQQPQMRPMPSSGFRAPAPQQGGMGGFQIPEGLKGLPQLQGMQASPDTGSVTGLAASFMGQQPQARPMPQAGQGISLGGDRGAPTGRPLPQIPPGLPMGLSGGQPGMGMRNPQQPILRPQMPQQQGGLGNFQQPMQQGVQQLQSFMGQQPKKPQMDPQQLAQLQQLQASGKMF